ncbi:MAG: hypothetical protein FWF57_08790 [Defluviitaleaceae bacterium]|nr:hypothetical protein [Defluviitaleaceae bacterium]
MKDNLKEERIMILEMVKENKIGPDDGVKLLNSLNESKGAFYSSDSIEEKFSKFHSSIDSFAKEVKSKIDSAYHSAEPKVKDATKKVVEKTANMVEELSKKLNEGVKKLEETEEKIEDKTETTIVRIKEAVENEKENNNK